MKSSRIVVTAVLAGSLVLAPAAAMAEDTPAAEPPVVAPPVAPPAPETPVAPAPVVTPPVISPPAPAPVHTNPPTGPSAEDIAAHEAEMARLRANLAIEGQAQMAAFIAQYGTALSNYTMKGGRSIAFDHATGIFTDAATGAVIDITAYGADADAVPAAAELVPATLSLAELNDIVAEPLYSADAVAAYAGEVTSVDTEASVEDHTAGAFTAGWIGVAALAFWRKRYRAFELLRALGRTA